MKKINRKYNCLVVLTSYDIEFDSGLVGSYLYNPNHELQNIQNYLFHLSLDLHQLYILVMMLMPYMF